MKSANLTVLGPFCMFGLNHELTLEIFQLELVVVLMIELFYFHLLSQNKVFFRKLESLLKVQPYKLKKTVINVRLLVSKVSWKFRVPTIIILQQFTREICYFIKK